MYEMTSHTHTPRSDRMPHTTLELFTGVVTFLEAKAEAEAEARSPMVIMQYNGTKADLGVIEIHFYED
ncbi:uncharacterized protein LAJ45_10968 [Morchella importuna]|uniref:uncharacterized protein n=1 Tax=Morchella importuna TaxID=1174673 RepID=UPI001E8E739E|nr:uncharacterized protein LAJ45_10968 [Morchella importuna]KAH8145057.1 hypothetical protein LAJ45_10968 [Morchella importuna]